MSRALLSAAIALTVCAIAAQPLAAASSSARRGLAFSEQRCAACHAVRANGSSANPESPSFEDIANRHGVTQTTLRTFLRDSHNYPAVMNFRVNAGRIRDLAAYIVTLRKPDYRPIM